MSQRSASSHNARPRVLVIYQHHDAEAQAQRLIQTLSRPFGADNVKNCYDLSPSALFPPPGGTGGFTVVIVLVGKKWLKVSRQPHSYSNAVHANQALVSALSSPLELIPVLVSGASMPKKADLPDSIDISHFSSQSVRLRDARWDEDVEKLVSSLERLSAPESESAAGEPASDDLVLVNLRREDAIKLVYALMINLGSAPGGYAKKGSAAGKAKGKALGGGKPLIEGKGGTPIGRSTTRETAAPADVVSTTVFSPRKVSPGATFMIQVTAHLPEDAAEAEQQARQAVTDAEKLGSKKLDYKVEKETKLSFALSLPSMEIDDPSQHLIWRGTPEAVQFGVTVPENHRPGNVIGTVRASQDGVPFGHVKFQITVAAAEAAASAPPSPQAEPEFVRYERAFVSYASEDRHEVLKRTQMLVRLVPYVFMDFMSLEPGERWAKGLYKHIDECDVFYIFWSTPAKESEWVMKELHYALARKGKDESAPPEIIPMVIEGPPPASPPSDLKHLHFNDLFMYLIAQTEETKK